MGKNFCKNWESLRKITEKFHVVKSHDSHSNQMCGENKREKRKSFRLCLVRVKAFPENISFSRNAIFWKGKYFHVFGCHKIHFTEN